MFDFKHPRHPVRDNLLQETAVFPLFLFLRRGIKYEMVSGEIYCSRIYSCTRAYPYRMIVWMHNASFPTQPIRSFRDRFDGATLYIYKIRCRHYKFISAILPELICSLGIAVINFIPADVSNWSFIDGAEAMARPTPQLHTYNI